jgi:hypothetical protein
MAHLGDVPHATPLMQYADEFFESVLSYARELPPAELGDSVQ